jgi:nanoRNase/pAp phosphatase (c-di-AMP/oligoRNAs hydrolase)
MMMLIDCCRDMAIDEILALPDVRERVLLFEDHHEMFRSQIRRMATVHDNLVVLDLRFELSIYAGNRFVLYAMFPECDISMHVMKGREGRNTVFTVGKSIFDRSNPLAIGDLMLRYGGGGHDAAGTCQIDNDEAYETKHELIRILADRGKRLARAQGPTPG